MPDLEKMLADIDKGVRDGMALREQDHCLLVKMDDRITKLETNGKTRTVSLPGCDDEKREFSFFRAMKAIATRDWSNAEFEQDIFKETAKRALSVGVDTAGGYLVPAQYMAQLVELQRAKAVCERMGATVMSGLTGSPVEIPKQSGGATLYWVGENADITESDQTYAQIKLTPHKAGALTKMSNRTIALTNPAMEGIVRADLAKVLALGIDLAALRGSGTSNQPLGIANTAGINTVAIGAAGGEITYAQMVNMIGEVEDDNALEGRPGWVFHSKVKRKIAKLIDGDQRPLFTWDPSVAQPSSVLIGYPWAVSTQIPTNLTKTSGTSLSEIYFGNWEELIIGQWGSLILSASTEAGGAFVADQTWIKIIQEVDVALRHETSMCLCNDVATV